MKPIASNRADIRCNPANILVADRVHIGSNVTFGPSCRQVRIGYGSFLGDGLYVDVEELQIGEYTTIHHGSVVHGTKCVIGHNCWFGHYTIIDSLGGDTRIGNNVGVGAHSQLWSHMKFGDVLNGCRWQSGGRLYLDDDVWLVGHTIIGPIHAGERAMLLTGGVMMKDMEANSIYSGSPAKDVSDRLGHQFEERSLEEKLKMFLALRDEFCAASGVISDVFPVVDEFVEGESRTQFNILQRSYRPIRSSEEYEFIRFMLYEKAKWLPA